jgi:uncharacterized protein (TIRG00374 family)
MAAVSDSPNATNPAPLPAAVGPRRLRRAVLKLGAVVVVVVVLVTLLPGLGELRERFAHASAGWIVVGCALEVLSCLAYVLAFRRVFCIRMSRRTSYKIAMSELGADSLLPVGGAGGLALGAWALRRGGMPTKEIADKTVAFFLLTSVPNVAGLALLGIGLAVHLLPGKANIALTVIPAVVAIVAVALTLLLGRLMRRLQTRSEGGRRTRVGPALRATADGIDEAVRLLRTGDPWLLGGVIGYMVFDIMVLWASFRAIGSTPEFATVSIAYVIGQLGNLIPIPGGIGGVELGLIGALVLYGLPAVTSTAAVLLYRVIELWVPGLLGLAAFVQLRAMLRREADAIDMCQPGEVVEVIGVGPVTKPIA